MSRIAAIGAIAATCVAAAPASAQLASYCSGGALRANAFYSNTIRTANGWTLEYHGQLMNIDAGRRSITATMMTPQSIRGVKVESPLTRLDLAPYQQKDVVLLTLRAASPSGTGLPSAVDVGKAVAFSCIFS